MSRRSIWFNRSSETTLEPHSENISGRVNAVLDRFAEILRRDTTAALSGFNSDEQRAIVTVCSSWSPASASEIYDGAAIRVETAAPADLGLSPQQASDLAAKLRRISFADQIVIDEWARAQIG